MGRQPAVIFDRDGTLASVAHVAPTDLRSSSQWRDFNAAMPFDAPVPAVADMLRAVPAGVTRIMTSGRSQGDHVGDRRRLFQMRDWLAKHDLPIDLLVMRPAGDMRSDDVVKRAMFHQIIAPRFDVQYVVDDRPQVVDMWRSLGLRVVQVQDPGILPPIASQR